MQKIIISILFLVVMAAVPSAAYAVTAIILVLNDTGTTLKSYTIAGSGNPLNISAGSYHDRVEGLRHGHRWAM